MSDEQLQEILLIDWIAIGLLIGYTVISLGFFWLFLSHFRTSGEKNKIQLAFIIFFLCMGISRVLLIYFDYFLTHLDSTEYINFILYWKIALVFQFIGIGSIIFAAENGVFKGKDLYIFLIGFIILLCVGLLHPDFVVTQTIVVLVLAFAIFIPVSYLYLAYKLPAARRNIVLIFVGFLIFGLGIMVVSPDLLKTFPAMIHELYLLSILIQIPGYVVFAFGIKRMYFT